MRDTPRYITQKTKTMDTKKTYYYNVANGVTPADHDIKYSTDWCEGEGGNHYVSTARLEISNGKALSDYIESPEGHYVEGLSSWTEIHDYLIDLVQAMLVELGRRVSGQDRGVGQLTAVITDEYADGSIDYFADYYVATGEVVLNVAGYGFARGKVATQEALDQMLCVTADDFDF